MQQLKKFPMLACWQEGHKLQSPKVWTHNVQGYRALEAEDWADIFLWSFCAEFSLKLRVDESFEIHVLMNFLRVNLRFDH